MAKRKKITEDEPQTTELALPSDDEVVKTVKRLAAMQKSVTSASGDMGDYVNKQCEQKDFDKRALGMARRLHSMPDEKFRITWPHLKAYAEALGFDERAEAQPEMFEEDAKPNGAGAAENVRQFRPGRQLDANAS